MHSNVSRGNRVFMEVGVVQVREFDVKYNFHIAFKRFHLV